MLSPLFSDKLDPPSPKTCSMMILDGWSLRPSFSLSISFELPLYYIVRWSSSSIYSLFGDYSSSLLSSPMLKPSSLIDSVQPLTELISESSSASYYYMANPSKSSSSSEPLISSSFSELSSLLMLDSGISSPSLPKTK
jgi:hypothetical protein